MALPRAVQKQVNEANEIMEELKKPPESVEAEQESQQEQEQEEQAASQPEPQQEPEPQEEPEQGAAPEPHKDDFEQKYKVLQGKYNAEVPRLNGQLRSLKEDLNAALQRIQQLEKPKKEAAPEVQQTTESLISEEEIEDYGSDFMDLVGRKAQEIANRTVADLKQEISELNEQLNGVRTTVRQTDHERFMSQLDQKVENWRTINEDARFLNWLDEPDVYAGTERGRLLREAYQKGDVERVAAFFNGFLKENAAVSDDAPSRPQGDTSKVSMDSLVAPGKQRGSTSDGARNQKRIWTEVEIEQFYADVAKGRYKKDPERKDQLERDIFSAMNEGRVQTGSRVPFANSAY